MSLDLPFAQVSRSVEQNVHTTFSFQNPLLESVRLFKDSALILDVIRRSFLTKSATAAIFNSVPVDFGQPPLSSSSVSFEHTYPIVLATF